jgi:hypothetical protein
MRSVLPVLLCALSLPAAVAAQEAPRPGTAPSAFVLTTLTAWQRSESDVESLRKLIVTQARLLEESRKSELVVATEALTKDLAALRELLVFAEERLASLKVDLAPDPANPRPLPDPLALSQVREIKLLRDQGERIYLSGKRFLEQMQRPTGTTIKVETR